LGPPRARSGAYTRSGAEQERPVSAASSADRWFQLVEIDRVRRESDGVVEALIAVSNAAGGKGSDVRHTDRCGKGEDMRGTARSKSPRWAVARRHGATTTEPVMAAAKQSQPRRFHALFGPIHRGDVL
jgi:RNA-directed DNA polymerase